MTSVDIEALIHEAHKLRKEAKVMRAKSEELIARAQKVTERVITHLQKLQPKSK
jgi:CHAD domain-containing protein